MEQSIRGGVKRALIWIFAAVMLIGAPRSEPVEPSVSAVSEIHKSIKERPHPVAKKQPEEQKVEPEPEQPEEPVKPAPEEPKVSKKEIELIALVTMAEAEGESEYGKRLVIDTILNRVDHPYWPDTITKVIYQPSQFSSMWNSRVDRCYVREDICQLVREELASRTNYDVVYFTAGDYGKYGTRLFQVGNHYFASY